MKGPLIQKHKLKRARGAKLPLCSQVYSLEDEQIKSEDKQN